MAATAVVSVEAQLFEIYRVYKQDRQQIAVAVVQDASQYACFDRLTRYETILDKTGARQGGR